MCGREWYFIPRSMQQDISEAFFRALSIHRHIELRQSVPTLFHRIVPAWVGFVPLLLLIAVRVVATLPGIATPHSHGGLAHTHASGGLIHAHTRVSTSGETLSSVRIAALHRPSDPEFFHSPGAVRLHIADASAPQWRDHNPPSGGEQSDETAIPGSYFCAASALVLSTYSPEVPIPPTPPAGLVFECTPVKQRAVWRTKSTRGPPVPVLPVELAFT